MLQQQLDNGPVFSAERHANRAAPTLGVGGVDVGAAPDQFTDDIDVALEAGDAQRQPGIAVNVGFLDIGPMIKGDHGGFQISFFDGSSKCAVHGLGSCKR